MHFLMWAILLSQLSTNASRVQIPLGHVIGTLVLTLQAGRSPDCTRGEEVGTDTQHQILALSLGPAGVKGTPSTPSLE